MSWSAPALLALHASETPEGSALDDGETAWTWRVLSEHADAAAAAIVDRGVLPGGRVALVVSNTPAAVAALIGVLRAGAVAAVVPAGLTTREVDAALEVIEPVLVLRDADLAFDRHRTIERPVDREPETAALVVLTSGTTDRPKGVVLSARAMAASADAWLEVLPPATGWAMPLGFGHVAGLGILWRAIRQRVPVRLVPPADPDALLTALHADPALSHVSLVPGQLVRLLDAAADAPPPASLRAAPPRRRHDPAGARAARDCRRMAGDPDIRPDGDGVRGDRAPGGRGG